jgi:tellurite resistance protein TehA-like permease
MGTGIVSILLEKLPYTGWWVHYLSIGFFALNSALFITFTALSVVRYSLYPEIWLAMLSHPAQSLFLGCFPMALASMLLFNLNLLILHL